VSEVYQRLSNMPERSTFDRVLMVDDGSGVVSHFPLVGDQIVIGRQEGVDLHLPFPSVSRKHAQLRCDKWGKWWIKDLGSSNGTCINGFTSTERVLELADRIDIGSVALTFTVPHEAMEDSSLHGGPALNVRDTDSTTKRISALRDDSVLTPRISSLQLVQLMELSRQLHTTDKLGQRLRLLCNLMIEEEFKGQGAVVVRISKEAPDEPPQTLCSPSFRPDCSQRSLFISQSMLKALRERAEPMLTNSTDTSAGESLGGHSALGCPIRNDELAVDLLYILVPPKYGNEEWLTLASLAADHFRQSENNWAARRLAKVSALVEVDMERARDIQLRLVPKAVDAKGLDVAIGFEPCRWVAGDYVDVIQLPDDKVLLIVADVCGKGMPAALVSSSMHTLVHASVGAGADLVQMTTLLNNYLVKYLPQNRFVTGIIIEIDPATGEMRFINAGHPSPIVIDPEGGRQMLDMGDYEPLGLVEREYAAMDGQLEPRHMLAMFTDGLTELTDQHGKMLTSTRIGEHLSSIHKANLNQPIQIAADQLSQMLDAYQGTSLQSDDRTFLLTCRPGE